MIEEIAKILANREQLAQQAQEQYAPLVNDIIASQTNDVNHISHTLDQMFDFCFDNTMLQQYRRLCRYLYTIDKETTAFYINAYREMWDQEGKQFENIKEVAI